MRKVNVRLWSAKKKTIVLTALAFVLVFISAMSYATVVRASDMRAIKKESAKSIEESTAQYVKNYVTSGGTSLSKDGADISGSLAKSVTTVTMDTFHSANLTASDVQQLVKVTEETINEQASAMGLDINDKDTKLLTSGVQAIVITNIYKAIANRGLVDVESLNVLKKALEERLGACEAVVSDQTDGVYAVIEQMTSVMNDLEEESENSSDAIVELNSKIGVLEEYVDGLLIKTGEGGSLETEFEVVVDSIDSIMDSLSKIDTTDASQKASLDDLYARLLNVQGVMETNGTLTKEELDALSLSLKETGGVLSKRLDEQKIRIDSLNSSLGNLSLEFSDELSKLQNAQTNTETILQNIAIEISEGGAVDARLAQLCNEMAAALGADLEGYNDALTSKIDTLGGAVYRTQSSLSQLEGEFVSVNVKISDLQEAQSLALTQMASDLHSRISAAGGDISSLQDVNSNLENLIAGNRVDITSLTSSLDTAKADLQKALLEAEEEQRASYEELLLSVEDTQALISESFEAQILAIERQFSVRMDELEQEQGEAIKNAAMALQSSIDETGSAVESLTTANASLQELVSGNATNISTLHTSLERAKEDLQKALLEAEEEQKEELESMLLQVENAQKAVGDMYEDRLLALETSINVRMDELKEAQTTALSAAADDLQSKIDATNLDLSSLQVTSNNLQGLIKGNSVNITTLASSLETAKTDLQSAMETADEEQKAEIEALIESVESAQEVVNSTYAAQLSGLSSLVNEKDMAQTNALEAAKTSLTTQLSSLSGNLSSAKGDIVTLQTSLSSVTTKAESNAQSITQIEESVSDINADITDISTEVSGVEGEIQSMKGQLESLSDTKAEITYDDSDGVPTLTIKKVTSQ